MIPGRQRPSAVHLPIVALLAVSVGVACTGRTDAAADNDLDALPRLVLEEELRIGSVDDPDYGFTSVSRADVDADGNVYVLERSDLQIRVYSSEGDLIRRIGGTGEGPGEFRDLSGFGVKGDSVWAIDLMLRRLSLFLRDGSVISTAPIQAVTVPLARTAAGNIMPVHMRDDGLFTSDMNMIMSARGMDFDVDEDDPVTFPRVLYDASGAPVDTVGWAPYPRRPSRETERVEVGGNRYTVPLPPYDGPVSVTLPDGRIVIEATVATSDEPTPLRITRLDLEDDTVFSRDYVYRPRPYDDAALDASAWRAARRPGIGVRIINGVAMAPPASDDSTDAFARIRGAMSFPPYQPPIRNQYIGNDGSLWLSRGDDGAADRRWTVLDPAGRPVGEVVLPATVFPMWMDRETVITRELDEFEVPWVVRYRIHLE